MTKWEAKAQTKWGHYILSTKAAGRPWYANFELKQSGTDTITWKRFDKKTEQNQIDNLVNAAMDGLYWKLSDEDRRVKPFDCFFAKPAEGFIVIWWRKHNLFTAIGIGEFLMEKLHSTEKSLSFEKAKQICLKIVKPL